MSEPIFDHDRLDVYRLDVESNLGMQRKPQRIVSMLTRMAMKPDGVAEAQTGYRVGGADDDEDGDRVGDDYEHELEGPDD